MTHISLVNIDANKSQEISVEVKGLRYNKITGRILTSKKLQEYNSFENPEKIKPSVYTGAVIKGNTLSVKLPPFSVVVLEVQ